MKAPLTKTWLPLLLIAALPAIGLAQDKSAAADEPSQRQRMQQFCQDQPDKCAQMRDYCRNNRDQCRQMREQMQAARQQLQQQCQQDPAGCEQKKQALRQQFMQRLGQAQKPAPAGSAGSNQ